MNLFWKKVPKTSKLEQDVANKHELYHAFKKTEKSNLLESYLELAEIDFKQARRHFKKKKDYLKSEFYQKELHLKELKQDSDICNYLAHEKSDTFNYFKNYKQTNFEEFTGNKIDSTMWIPAYSWSYNQVKGNYTSEGEFQAYTEGENTDIVDGELHITTKRKEKEGRTWKSNVGFINLPYKFTSDLISGMPITMNDGCLMIKFRLEGASKSLQHFITLHDEKNRESIILMQSKKKNKFVVGKKTQKGNKTSTVSGINLQKDFHILEMEWNHEIISWRINGVLIWQENNTIENKDMNLVIGSRVRNKKGKEGKIIVDYVRLFGDRNAIEKKTKKGD
jgi:hypothetical protein